MSIVIDTNVVVSALIWGGTPYKLLQAAIDIDLYTSPALLMDGDSFHQTLHREALGHQLSATAPV